MSSGALIGTKGVPRAEREEQILAYAVAEFARRGYAASSMIEIAARAGISKPLVYQYFGSKDGLYLACLHHVAGSLLERLNAAQLDEDDSVASRIHTLRAIFEALDPQRIAWQFLYDTSMPTTGEVGEAVEHYRGQIAQLAAIGSERFLLARGDQDPLDASALTHVWTGIVNSLVTWWIDHPDETAEQMLARCLRLISAVLQ